MSKRNEVKVNENAENKVVEEAKVGFFTKIGEKCDNGVRFVRKHWKPIIGVGAAGAAAAAGLAAFKGFNNDLGDDVNLNSSQEEDPLA